MGNARVAKNALRFGRGARERTQATRSLVVIVLTTAVLLRLLRVTLLIRVHAKLRQRIFAQLTISALNPLALREFLYGLTCARPPFTVRPADFKAVVVQSSLDLLYLTSAQALRRDCLLIGRLSILPLLRLGLLLRRVAGLLLL